MQAWVFLVRLLTSGLTIYLAHTSGDIWVSSWRVHCIGSSRLRRRSMWDTTRQVPVRVSQCLGSAGPLQVGVSRTSFNWVLRLGSVFPQTGFFLFSHAKCCQSPLLPSGPGRSGRSLPLWGACSAAWRSQRPRVAR